MTPLGLQEQDSADRACPCGTPLRKSQRRFCSRLCAQMLAPIGVMNRKYDWTPERDAAVKRLWLDVRWGARKVTAARHPLLCGIPYGTLKWRAMRLGVRRGRGDDERPWSAAESGIVETFAGELAVEAIQRRLWGAGYHRTLRAIVCRLSRRYYGRPLQGATLTVRDVAAMFGVDWHKVEEWIRRDWLHAEKSAGAGRYRIAPASLARFIRTHGEALSKRPVDVAAVVALLDDHPRVGRPKSSLCAS